MKNKYIKSTFFVFLALVFYFSSKKLSIMLSYALYYISDMLSVPRDFFVNKENLVYIIVNLVLILVFGLIYLKFVRQKNAPKIKFNKGKGIALSFVIGTGVAGLAMVWLIFADDVLSKINFIRQSMETHNSVSSSIEQGAYIWLFLAACVVGPIIEELVFRGLIFNCLERSFSKALPAIIISGIAFGMWHEVLVQGVYASFMGIVLGIIYYKTRDLRWTILIHMINNIISTLPPAISNSSFADNLNLFCVVMIFPMLFVMHKVIKTV